jgi:hypothetical protein
MVRPIILSRKLPSYGDQTIVMRIKVYEAVIPFNATGCGHEIAIGDMFTNHGVLNSSRTASFCRSCRPFVYPTQLPVGVADMAVAAGVVDSVPDA